MNVRREIRWWGSWTVAAAAALAANAQVAPPPDASPPLHFLFDGHAYLQPGLSLSFSRNSDSVSAAGDAIGPDTARFGDPALLCGAPEVSTVPSTAGLSSINLLAAGVSSDNATPALVIFNSDWGHLRIDVGADSAQTYVYSALPNPAKGGLTDGLRDSVDNSPDEAWIPRAAVLCHGEAILMCNVAVRDGAGGFTPNRIGFASCNLAHLAGPKQFWWRRIGYSDILTTCTDDPRIGSTWSMQTWFTPDRSSAPPTRFWVCAADYRAATCKDGGAYVVFPVSRPSTSSTDWTPDAPMELPGRFFLATLGTHAHAVGLTRYGAQGLIALGSRGDSLYNNVNYTWTLADESAYRAGATVLADAINYYAGGANWSAPREVHGSITTPQAPASTRALGNQWVSICPGPAPGTFLTGADEVNQALWLSSPITGDPAHIGYSPVYTPSPSNWIYPESYSIMVQHRYLAFHIAAAEPSMLATPYAAQLGASQFGGEHSLSARILYSADGLSWGHCWAHRENELANIGVAGGRIYCGSIGQSLRLGVRSIPIPATRTLRPLRVAPGGTNYAAPSVTITDTPAWVSAAPCVPPAPRPPALGPCAHFTVAAPANAGAADPIGSITLARNVPPDAWLTRLRVWIRADTLAEGGPVGSLGLQVRLRSTDDSVGPSSQKISGYCQPFYLPGTGAWTPLILSTNFSSWGAQDNPATVDLQFRCASGQWTASSFSVLVDSFINGSIPPGPLAPQATGDDEHAAITGFSLAGDWTTLVAGAIPPDSWDAAFTSDWFPYVPLLSVVDSASERWVEVMIDPLSYKLVAWYWNGSGFASQTATITGIYCVSASPVLVGLSYNSAAQSLELTASVGGTEPATAMLPGVRFNGPVTQLRLGSPRPYAAAPAMDWFGGSVEPALRTPAQVAASLRSLDFLLPTPCPADFDVNGFVNGDDFDFFAAAFEFGQPAADFDQNTFVNGDDFDSFSQAFENGC